LGSFALATLGLVLVLYPAMSYWWAFGDFAVIYGTDPVLTVLTACVHGAGLAAFFFAAERLVSQRRAEHWAALAARDPARLARLSDANAPRLRALETSWTRFLPGARQELLQLRELRDWIAEHNRQPAGEQAEDHQ